MRAFELLTEQEQDTKVTSLNQKLEYIRNKLTAGEVDDPETIDYIYKILNKPQIKSAIEGLVGKVSGSDPDVKKFNELNNGVLSKILRKLPVQKEELDDFLDKWSSGKGLVNIAAFKSGSRGSISDLIPDPVAFKVFEVFEQIRSAYRMPKKGTSGYGEFGLAMLSPMVRLKAPGDIEVNGQPIEMKGNDSRLYSDERGIAAESLIYEKRGDAPGLLTNVIAGIQSPDETVKAEAVKNAVDSFVSRGVSSAEAKRIVEEAQSADPASALKILSVEWWKASFSSYQRSIKMPIMVIGFGQYLISDKADDFVSWGCLPKKVSNYGYMFGRKAGQTRETYPKIFVPGHNI